MINTTTVKNKWNGWTPTRKCQVVGFLLGVLFALLATCGGRYVISQRGSLGGEIGWIFLISWDLIIVGTTRSLVRFCGLDWVNFGVNSNEPPFFTLCVIILINAALWGIAGLIIGHCIGYFIGSFKKRRTQ